MRNFEIMRYFFPILVLFTTIFVSCKDNSAVTTSSEARVHTFSFYADTLNPGLTAATYKIEHNGDTGRIYCVDSLRFGTRLDKVVPYVTYQATPGSATFYLPNDTIISTGVDTMNFNLSPIYLHVISSDLTTEQWYKFDIHVHQSDPDLFVWDTLKLDPITKSTNYETKAFLTQNGFALFVNNGLSTELYQSTNGKDWTQTTSDITMLPVPCRVRDIVQENDTLYYIDNNCLYTSTNLVTWTKKEYSSASFTPITMLLSYNNLPWCIVQDTATQQLMLGTIVADSIYPQTNIEGTTHGFLPSSFPISEFAALSFKSSSERPRAMIVGGRDFQGNIVNDRWNIEYASTSSYRLKNFSIMQPDFESMTGISIIQYNGQLIMLGGINSDLTWRNHMYYSKDEGMNWHVSDTTKTYLPYSENRYNQTVLIDSLMNIYIIGGQSHTHSFSDVYCGYLNSAKWK